MNWIRIGRCLPLLPQAWGSSFVYSKRKTDQAYKRCRQWAQKVLKRIGMTFTVWGRSNIPEKGCLLVSNHQGTLDPVLVMASCSQPVYFIAKEGAGKLPVIGRWARNIETILFDRDTKEGNIYMLREALRRLKKRTDRIDLSRRNTLQTRCDESIQAKIFAAGLYGKGAHCTYHIKSFLLYRYKV